MFRHVFAFDPGDANNGFVYLKYNSETKTADTKIKKVLDGNGLEEMLKIIWGIGQTGTDIEMHFVIENFRIDNDVRGKIFQWGEVVTVRNIGKVEMVAKWLGGTLVIQEPAHVIPQARKWAPKWVRMPKTGHPPDDSSAWCHGVHYMMKRQWISTPDQVIQMGQERLI